MDPFSPDLQALTADITKALLKDAATSLFERAKALTGDQLNKLKLALKVGLEDYVANTVARVATVKTLLYRDRSVPIGQIYVDTSFETQNKTISEGTFFRTLSLKKRAIVTGAAGCGKSIFMKHCVLAFAQGTVSPKIPIFVELRHINHFSSSIMHFMLEEILKPSIRGFDTNALDYALTSGIFVLVLDGFDEVNFDRVPQYLQELTFISQRYPELQIVLSTRPEEATLALDGFDVFHVNPLSKHDAIQLIEQLEYEPEVKGGFLKALDNQIYDSHTEFASNPLLLTMLLLTYDQVREAPQKMHIFFNQAFEALVFKHDRLKSLYQRQTHSALDVEALKKIYSWFCAVSYFEGEYSFNEQRVDDLLHDAMDFHRIDDERVADVKKDLIYSYSMLKRDGLFITFVHRSFQEYFCAFFISRSDEIDMYRVVDGLATRGRAEQCLSMLYDIAPERILIRWMLPFLIEIASELEVVRKDGNRVRLIYLFYHGIFVTDRNRLNIGKKKALLEKLELCAELIGPDLSAASKAFLDEAKRSGGPVITGSIDKFFGGNTPFGLHPVPKPPS